MADALRAGATALQDLIRSLGDKADADLAAAYTRTSEVEAGDARDYRAMAELVRQDLEANLDHPSPDHRQGYLRALTDLLSIVADGFHPGSNWDPIKDTAAAFARPEGARHV
jgi:hypothetical protein